MLENRRKALMRLLQDPDDRVQEVAGQVLEKLEAAAALEHVLERLKTGSRGEKIQALFSLGGIRSPRVFAPLLAALKHSDQDLRVAALQVLGEKKNPKTLGQIVPLLKDPSPAVRSQAVEVLGNFHDARLVSYLAEVLKERDVDLMLLALRSLGQVGAPEGEKVLVHFLTHPEPRVRREAALALGELDLPE